MGYIGNFPTAVPLTTNDLGDNIVTADKLDLTDDYAFTGNVTGAGITMVQQWNLTSNSTVNGTHLTNWAVANDTLQASMLGSSMTESSGIFSFPSTGYYKIDWIGTVQGQDADAEVDFHIRGTTDNSTYGNITSNLINMHTSGHYHDFVNSAVVKITDLTNHKVKFFIESNTTPHIILGGGQQGYTFVIFTRLAGI